MHILLNARSCKHEKKERYNTENMRKIAHVSSNFRENTAQFRDMIRQLFIAGYWRP